MMPYQSGFQPHFVNSFHSLQSSSGVGGNDEETMFGVFVGDLPQDANEQDLIKLFTLANFPVVKCKIIRDMDNNSKRYGFVHFPTEEMRQKAIIDMHGVTLKGQTINVRTQHYKETDRCLVKMGTKKTDIYIGNIPRTLTKHQVRDSINDWDLPNVQDIKVFKNDTGMFSFISFLTEREVGEVMEELKNNPRTLAGRELLVQSSGTSITSTLNAEILRNPAFAQSPEEQHIIQSVQILKLRLGGENCPLNERQLALLEKSQRTLYVRNLHPDTKEVDLTQKFNTYGKLRKVIIVTDKDTKVPMGYGFVEFYSGEACAQAAQEDNCELDNQLLTLQVSRPPKDIHAIITQAGMTDANGNLTNLINPVNPGLYQDSQGQIFMLDTQFNTQMPMNSFPPTQAPMMMQNFMAPPLMMPNAMFQPQVTFSQQMAAQAQVQQMAQAQQLQQAQQLMLLQQMAASHQYSQSSLQSPLHNTLQAPALTNVPTNFDVSQLNQQLNFQTPQTLSAQPARMMPASQPLTTAEQSTNVGLQGVAQMNSQMQQTPPTMDTRATPAQRPRQLATSVQSQIVTPGNLQQMMMPQSLPTTNLQNLLSYQTPTNQKLLTHHTKFNPY